MHGLVLWYVIEISCQCSCGGESGQVKQIVDPLLLSDADVDRLMTTLLREMECGLSRDPQRRRLTSLQMENTYVRSLLDGTGLMLLTMVVVIDLDLVDRLFHRLFAC